MSLSIVDTHFHFYDTQINDHPFLSINDKKLWLLWGQNYHKILPPSYLPADYLRDMKNFHIEHLAMAELVATDPPS